MALPCWMFHVASIPENSMSAKLCTMRMSWSFCLLLGCSLAIVQAKKSAFYPLDKIVHVITCLWNSHWIIDLFSSPQQEFMVLLATPVDFLRIWLKLCSPYFLPHNICAFTKICIVFQGNWLPCRNLQHSN